MIFNNIYLYIRLLLVLSPFTGNVVVAEKIRDQMIVTQCYVDISVSGEIHFQNPKGETEMLSKAK